MAHVTLLQFDPHAFILPASAAPGVDVIQNRPFLAFADDATETATTKQVAMPGQYAGGTLKVSIGYMMATATADKVDFEVQVEAVTDGDTHDLQAGEYFDSVNEVAGGTTVPGVAGYLDVITITLTNKDGVLAGDMVRLKFNRDHDDADDTASGDAQVLWMELWEET